MCCSSCSGDLLHSSARQQERTALWIALGSGAASAAVPSLTGSRCMQADAADMAAKEGGSGGGAEQQQQGGSVADVLADQEYVKGLLGSLPGVDVSDPALQVHDCSTGETIARLCGNAHTTEQRPRLLWLHLAHMFHGVYDFLSWLLLQTLQGELSGSSMQPAGCAG